jgi:hypothetical protein
MDVLGDFCIIFTLEGRRYESSKVVYPFLQKVTCLKYRKQIIFTKYKAQQSE